MPVRQGGQGRRAGLMRRVRNPRQAIQEIRKMMRLHRAAGQAPAADHTTVFHAFAEGLARMLRRRSTVARVRAVRG
jgi:hypothetical protein